MIISSITVYDPPTWCSTGVGGPEVDPQLARLAGDLDWLWSRGVEVRRFDLAQKPARLGENAAVEAMPERSGSDELPAIAVGNQIVASAPYPGRDERAAVIGLAGARAAIEATPRVPGLIALGAASGASCEPRFKFHYDQARGRGLSGDAMVEADRVGEAAKAGRA